MPKPPTDLEAKKSQCFAQFAHVPGEKIEQGPAELILTGLTGQVCTGQECMIFILSFFLLFIWRALHLLQYPLPQ